MIFESLDVRTKKSGEYVKLQVYSLSVSKEMPSSEKRPIVLICPGGGYEMVSDREAEPIAMKFLSEGIHAAVLTYSVVPVKYPVQLEEVENAMKALIKNSDKYHIDKEQIFLAGFSAGGHLAASYVGKNTLEKNKVPIPKGLILSYPVITSGIYKHEGSICNLIGENNKKLEDEVSVEKLITKNMPAVFVWHTKTDPVVPVENTLMLVEMLKKNKVNYKEKIYPTGTHGLSLANHVTNDGSGKMIEEDVQEWINKAIMWIWEIVSDK